MILYIRRVVWCVLADTSMSGPSETQRLAGMLFTKIREVEELTTSLVKKVEDGAFDLTLTTRDIMTVVDKIDKKIDHLNNKIDNNDIFMIRRFDALENGEGVLYGEVGRLRNDVAVLAVWIHHVKELMYLCTVVMFMMIFVFIYVVPLVPLEQKFETLVQCSQPWVDVVVDGVTEVWNITKNLNGATFILFFNPTP
jgi:hypothetical protein